MGSARRSVVREIMPEQPFQIGDVVCRIGYEKAWVVESVRRWKNMWLIGVTGQLNGWPEWPSDEFVLVHRTGQFVPFMLSA